MVIDLFGNEIKEDEWTAWKNPQTISLEFTKQELEAIVTGLEAVHGEYLKESTKLRACAASAAILSVLFRALRHLD